MIDTRCGYIKRWLGTVTLFSLVFHACLSIMPISAAATSLVDIIFGYKGTSQDPQKLEEQYNIISGYLDKQVLLEQCNKIISTKEDPRKEELLKGLQTSSISNNTPDITDDIISGLRYRKMLDQGVSYFYSDVAFASSQTSEDLEMAVEAWKMSFPDRINNQFHRTYTRFLIMNAHGEKPGIDIQLAKDIKQYAPDVSVFYGRTSEKNKQMPAGTGLTTQTFTESAKYEDVKPIAGAIWRHTLTLIADSFRKENAKLNAYADPTQLSFTKMSGAIIIKQALIQEKQTDKTASQTGDGTDQPTSVFSRATAQADLELGECPGCEGKGKVRCGQCGGYGWHRLDCRYGCIKGSMLCRVCEGTRTESREVNGVTESIKCTRCQGRGSEDCPNILKLGKIVLLDLHRHETCKSCRGTGVTDCPFCRGTGKAPRDIVLSSLMVPDESTLVYKVVEGIAQNLQPGVLGKVSITAKDITRLKNGTLIAYIGQINGEPVIVIAAQNSSYRGGIDNNGDGDTTDPGDDFDGDGMVNSIDTDDDNDGIPDNQDTMPFSPMPQGTAPGSPVPGGTDIAIILPLLDGSPQVPLDSSGNPVGGLPPGVGVLPSTGAETGDTPGAATGSGTSYPDSADGRRSVVFPGPGTPPSYAGPRSTHDWGSLVCTECAGTGYQSCIACGGTGYSDQTRRQACIFCDGTGWVRCEFCGGDGLR